MPAAVPPARPLSTVPTTALVGGGEWLVAGVVGEDFGGGQALDVAVEEAVVGLPAGLLGAVLDGAGLAAAVAAAGVVVRAGVGVEAPGVVGGQLLEDHDLVGRPLHPPDLDAPVDVLVGDVVVV